MKEFEKYPQQKKRKAWDGDRAYELIQLARKNKGAGVTVTPDPITAERHREFMKTKKFTHGDYEPGI